MEIEYNGHSCFTIKTSLGTIVTDPFGEEIPYPVRELRADIVTVSHEHFDHNAVSRVKGSPYVIKTVGEHKHNGILIRGFQAFHDKNKGSQRGQTVIFIIGAENLKVCHLGDLGELLDESQIKMLGDIDILLIPVGGFFTIEPEEAKILAEKIKPRIVIPMHYKTDYIKDWNIKPVEEFLRGISFPVKRINSSKVTINEEDKPLSTEVYLLKI